MQTHTHGRPLAPSAIINRVFHFSRLKAALSRTECDSDATEIMMSVLLDYEHDYHYHDHDNSSNHSDYDDKDFADFHTVCDKQEVRSFAGVFLPVVYTLALILGLAGNSLVILIYLSHKRLRTLTDVFILNLAFADLLLLLTLPFWAADAVNGWEIGTAACKITSALYTTNFSCSMLLLACISIDRYRALARGSATANAPARSNARRQRIIMCLMVWGLAIVLGLPDMVFYTVKKQHSSGRNACRAVYPHSMARAAKATLEILEVSLSFLLPFLVMMFCYCRVGILLGQAATAGVRGGRRWRAFRVLIAVVGVFLLTQLPYNVVKLVRALDVIYILVTECEVSKNLDRANQITESLALTHCCLNPVLYVFIGSSFKMHVLKLVKRCGQTGRGYRHGNEQPTVEISLKSGTQTHTHSSSENEDTSTFTI
ncbi:atypical chemokine receptor 4-like [Sinocyclocheilus anshuiensis]|uniref:Atypical chemokine receptor 4-like n=1 Tax=Sinocyclocheilus anshuiensis TaxID=1608454 RepID=A0A671KBF9_9TELE|nr:PREDICTED: atypical chemokine receptor 4-like [Sinocyclocheilus anshuiensis]